MARIHVVTDTGSDLPEKIRQELNIHVVPLSIQFGDDIYRDGIDLSVAEFYQRLQNDEVPKPASLRLQIFKRNT